MHSIGRLLGLLLKNMNNFHSIIICILKLSSSPQLVRKIIILRYISFRVQPEHLQSILSNPKVKHEPHVSNINCLFIKLEKRISNNVGTWIPDLGLTGYCCPSNCTTSNLTPTQSFNSSCVPLACYSYNLIGRPCKRNLIRQTIIVRFCTVQANARITMSMK